MKKFTYWLCVFVVALLSSSNLYSQMTVPSSGNNSYTTCSGNLYDFGGAAGNYGTSWDGYTVLNPSIAGNMIQISGTTSGESCCDYVRIYNGVGTGGTLLGTYYMNTAVPILTSSDATGALTVLFHSDTSIEGAGFDLTVSCVAGASAMAVPSSGNNSYTTCSGNLYDFGGAAANYGSSWDGYTVLNPSIAGNMIQISGTTSGESCCDYVRIYNGVGTGGTLLGTYYMNTAVPSLTSSDATGALTVLFHSDGSIEGAGFNLTVNCVAVAGMTVPSSGNNSYTTCSGNIYDFGGAAGDYANNWDGYTVLNPSVAGNMVQVSGTIAGEACCDYLYIYDGVGTGGTLLWSGVTSTGAVPLTTSTLGPLTIRFTSDVSNVGAGFNLAINCVAVAAMTVPSSGNNSYTTCSGNIYDFGGAAGDYANNWDGYTVLNPSVAGNMVQVSGTIAGEACCDYLYIYDGVGTGGTLLWSGVTSTGAVPLTTSTSGPLTIRFTSDVSNVGAGFNLAINCVAVAGMTVPSTGNNAYTTCAGNIYDFGGAAGDYGTSWDGYTVLNPSVAGDVIQVSGTIAGETCCDYLYIYDGVGTGGALLWSGVTSTGAVPVTTSTSGSLTIRFTSDGSVVGAGFNLSIACVPSLGPCASVTPMVCGTTYSGNLLAQVGSWSGYTDCTWGAGHEVVYSFTPTTTGVHTFTGTAVSGDPDFFLMNSCGNTGTNIIGSCWGSGVQTPNLTAGTTYYLIVDNYSSSFTADYSISVTCPNPLSTDCPSSAPFCTSNSYSFPAGVNQPDMGAIACLGSSPNPAWYYMEIDNPGNIIISISSGADVDFVAWGPYPDLATACSTVPITDCPTCPNNTSDPTFYPFGEIIDCSYSIAATETANIMGASSGDVYVLLLTNYANVVTNISFVQSAGAGSTNCGIVAPPVTNNGPLCVGQTLELYVSNPTAGATYAWTGPDGWTSNTMEPNRPNATTAMAGVYSLVITVGGVNSAPVTTTVVIDTYPNAGITNNTGSTVLTCSVTPISVTATGGGTYSWSGGSSTLTAANTFSSPATYTVTVTNGVCTDTESITITQDITPPTAGITNNTGTTILTCSTTAISVTATGGGTYAWSGGATPANAANSLTTPGTYTVTVTAANGCTATSSITITQNITPPTAGITNNTGTTILTCTTTAISVTATGGGTYAWSGGATPATAANSLTTPGTYTVTVTAANGCTATSSITITQNITPPTVGITNNTGTTILTCTTAAISVTATGGGTYAWSGGATPATAANSLTTPGTYTVTVTAANGCTATASITITQNITPPVAAITNNTGTTILTCTTAAISVTATGGGTYAWSGGATPATAANSLTTPGTYTVTVTAANGCTATSSITITQNITPPVAAITNNTGTTVLTCTTTAISVTATGGGTYAWSGGATPATAANSLTTPGTYTVTVTAANGCTATASITITQNITPPTAAITNNTGTTVLDCTITAISVTATGGGTYAWSGGATPATAANSLTTPGTYTVTVTGANGCTATASITITQTVAPPPAAITNNTGTTVLTCATTAISVTATGGVTYAWSGGATPATAANSLTTSGTYTVTVTAANGCTATASITITQNITPPAAAITNNTGTTVLDCTITAISVTATGGGTYAWSGGATPATAANSLTTPGTYTVTVTAANGCTAAASITITQNITPPTAGITNNTGTTILTCTTTAILVTATGGGTYAWSGGATPATAANSLTTPGTYTVTVTAANGCTATASITITQNITPPTAAITNNTGTTVLDCTITAISVTATGGGTYAWSGGATPATAANSLTTPGTYTVTVTGANGCTATASITITQTVSPPSAAITNNTGTTVLDCTITAISVTATGGVTYAWSGGATPATAANSLTTPGTYTVTVTAANGCTATASITITQNITPPPAAITNNTGTTVLDCTITAISVTATGGGTYSWSGGATPATAANSLTTPGTYTVTVTAANGCTATASITITQNITPPVAAITNNTGTTILTCTTTAISVTATGGGTYAWSGGATPATAANSLTTPGTYTVTVTAANGCTATSSITITQNITPPVAAITNNTGTTILTCTTTAISVTATGGGTYAWSGGATPATAANSLTTPGTYTVTVTAANGCTATASITITQNITPPVAAITNNTGTTILTCTTTAISVTATGGGTYAWSGGATPATAANSLTTPGTYTVTVTAANGCTATASITITQNITPPTAAITNNTGTTILTCTTTAISVTATGGGTYAWSGGATPGTAANSLTTPGTYTVTVTAANGCTATSSITITQNITPPTAGITNNSGTTVITCSLLSISVTATGGASYAWSGGSTPLTANNSLTAAGTYTVTVTGANGCTSTASITITDALTITASVTASTNQNCSTPGSATIQGASGIAPYSYSWPAGAGGVVGGTASSLPAGTYVVSVYDANMCSVTQSVTIIDIGGLTGSATMNSAPLCFGGNQGSINVSVVGGIPNYNINWGSGSFSSPLANYTITGLTQGTYNITVTDVNSCQVVVSATVTQPTQLTASSSATAIMCNGGNSTVTVSAAGGTLAYSGTGTYTVAAGTHNYTVTDANGCTANTSVTVGQPSLLTASSSATAILCNGGNSTVTVSAVGGTPSYSGTGTFAVTAGTYNYTVTDANGCTSNTSVTVAQPTLLVASSSATAIMCNGGNSTITVSAVGGTPAYSGTGSFVVSSGIHNYTVTDANGCTSNTSVNISQPSLLTASSSATAILCNGGNSTVTVTGSGGTLPYSGAGTFTVTAGVHSYTVTDANGCTATTSVNISQPTALTASSSATIIACNGGNSTVTVTGAGGTLPYTGAGTFVVTAGTYNYTVTDANGCTANTSVTVTQPTLLTASSVSTAILCNGGTSTVTVSGSGGTAPYSGTGSFVVSAGTYNYTVTDSRGCTANTSITISQPTALTASSSATAILCNGGNSTVTVTGAGGTAPYSGTGSFTVTAGTHNYTVTDANGCTANTSITISQPTAFTASSSATVIACNGGTSTVTVSGSGGTLPYSGAGTFVVTAGTYNYTVTDANGCTANTSITVTQPTLLTASSTATAIMCNGGSSTVTVSGAGGTGPYSGTGSFVVSAGTYNYTVTDSRGCTAITSITVSQPTALTASSSATAILCNGGTSTVTVTGAGGTAPYSGTGTFTVTSGVHSYTVTDANGCTANTSVNVTQPSVLTASSSATPVGCSGGNSTITVSAVGGTPAYTGTGTFVVPAGTYNYVVTDVNGCSSNTSIVVSTPTLLVASATSGTILCNGGTTIVTVSASGGSPAYSGIGTFTVSAGLHTYTITDANGCTANASVNVSQPTLLTASATAGTILCNGGTTTVNVTATGGTMAYSGTGTFTVSAGTHNYTVTDANGCTSNTSVNITQPNLLTASSTATEILCNGGTSVVTVTAAGGTPAYGGTGTFVVSAGPHSYTVTDANGCSANTSINITEPTWLTATAVSGNILCNGGTTTMTVSGLGGTPPYSGAGTFTVSAGNYTYTVTDDNGCITFASETVNQPMPLVLSETVSNALCFGWPGSATVNIVSGGTNPCSILWQDNTSLFTNNNIPVNTTFTYVVTDANGCQLNGDVFVTQPTAIQLTVSSSDVSCYGDCDGNATVSVTGGVAPYTTNWSNAATTQSIGSLCAGLYQVTVTDANGCEAYSYVNIGEPSQLQIFITESPAQCGGSGGTAFASFSGGTASYTISWSDAQLTNPAVDLEPGTYFGSVTDDNGCIASQSFDIGISGNINAQITQISGISCPDKNDGILQANSSNGQTPLSFGWDIPSAAGTVSNLGAGTYVVTVTDAWGCQGVDNHVLVNPVAMVVNASITDVACYGENNGAISVSVVNGTPPYSYVWNTPGSGSFISGLFAGTYDADITDDSGCVSNASFVVSQPDMLVLTSIVNNISCYGNFDGGVMMSATGGTLPYTFSIFDGSIYGEGSSHFTLSGGDYLLEVEDHNGCADSTNVLVLEPSEMTATFISSSPSCIGNNDGYVQISVIGGTEPYLFGWNNSFIDIPYITGLINGEYNIVVTDANNCLVNLGTTILTDEQVDCIKIPNAFSPNSDGINDTWIIENIDIFPGSYTYVYNRWGQEMFVGRPDEEPWDGMYNSKYVPVGTYLYVINLFNGTPPYVGIVTVIQ